MATNKQETNTATKIAKRIEASTFSVMDWTCSLSICPFVYLSMTSSGTEANKYIHKQIHHS